MSEVTIANIAGGEDTSPANTSKIEIEVGGVSKFAQLVNILKNAIPIGGTTPAAGAFTTLKQTTGKAAGAIPISDADGALTLTASTGSGAPVRAGSPTFTGTVTSPGYTTGSGITASTAAGTAVKLFTLPGNGLYHIFVHLNAPDVAHYGVYAVVLKQGNVQKISILMTAPLMNVTLNGADVEATQTSGIAKAIYYEYQRIN